jgi:hypothetical protein
MRHYHNTTPVHGVDLFNNEHIAKTQDERILFLFQVYRAGTPSETMKRYDKRWPSVPLTSIRRSISNLTRDGKLEQTGNMYIGLYGKPENEWRLKI